MRVDGISREIFNTYAVFKRPGLKTYVTRTTLGDNVPACLQFEKESNDGKPQKR